MPDTHPRGAFKDIGHWIKKHPLASAIIGVILGVLVYLVVTNSQSQTEQSGLSTNQLGTDNNPIHTIVDNPPSSTPSSNPPSNPGGTMPPVMPPTKPPFKKPPKRKGKPIIKKGGKDEVTKGTTHTTIHNPIAHGHTPEVFPIRHAPGHGPAHMPPLRKGPPQRMPPVRKTHGSTKGF